MLISGKATADRLQDAMRQELATLKAPRAPGLAFILVGEHAPSYTYVKMKHRACERVGIKSYVIELPNTTTAEQLKEQIQSLNENPAIDGILVQLPLPFDAREALATIDPRKDVDGFHPFNFGKLLQGDLSGPIPCTPYGIYRLLQEENIAVAGKHVVIVGRSNIVGKPLAALLMQNAPGANATVTVAHSRTENLAALTRQADILVAAIGKPQMVTANMVKEGAVVIDVGINRVDDPSSERGYRLVGDVDFDQVAPKARAITPVPGGIGPMTVTMLLHNTIQSFSARQ